MLGQGIFGMAEQEISLPESAISPMVNQMQPVKMLKVHL
jgi:hypothetical protein